MFRDIGKFQNIAETFVLHVRMVLTLKYILNKHLSKLGLTIVGMAIQSISLTTHTFIL